MEFMYHCSKHKEQHTLECQECINKLKQLMIDKKGHIVTDPDELKEAYGKDIKFYDIDGNEIRQIE